MQHTQKKPVRYLVLDRESKGKNMMEHDLLSVGACIYDAETAQIVDTFKVYVKPQSGSNETGWEERCLKECWDKNPE